MTVNQISFPLMIFKFRGFIIGAAFLCVAIFLYSACRNAAFIWDDQFLVVKNPLIRSPILFFEIFRHFLGGEPASNFYRPIQTLSYLIDYWRGGLNSTVYHDSNVLIHGLNAILIYLFVNSFLRRETSISEKKATLTGCMLGLIWLVHPIHSATVAYISGRADSLSLLFLLSAWCLWDVFLKSNGKSRWFYGFLVFLCGFLAICSKEAALIGVGVFVIWTWFSNHLPGFKQKAVVLGCSIVLLGTYLVLRNSVSASEALTITPAQGSPTTLIIRALGDYLRLLVFPDNLRMERQVVMVPNLFSDPASFDGVYPWLAVLGIVFVGLLILATVIKGPLRNVRRLGVLWFVASILPVSNLFTLNATVAEHWLYIPSIGFFLILTGWILETSQKTQHTISIIVIAAAIGLAMRTKIRVLDWSSPTTFFASTIRNGGDTARMRVNLANEYQLHGNPKRAEELLRSVLILSPNYPQARHAMVVNLNIQGRTAEAQALYPEQRNAFGDGFLGKLYMVQRLTADGQWEKSFAELKKLREKYPNSWLVTKEIGSLLEKIERPQEKIALYKNFTERHWWHAESHLELGQIYETNRDWKAAAIMYQQASCLDIRDTAIEERAEKLRKLVGVSSGS